MQRILRHVDYTPSSPPLAEQRVAMEVALEHIGWLRRVYPRTSPRTAAYLLGAGWGATSVTTWDDCAQHYARAWIAALTREESHGRENRNRVDPPHF